MKNAKKILLLVLSLVLLIGVFAVAAFAEEEVATATVVYPDGSTVEVAVETAIEPKAFENGLYAGEGNTLFKDDATEGWTFTVEGADTALTDLTVTADMAGKKIIAGGVQQVYSTIDITFKSIAEYWKWYEGSASAASMKFVKAGESYVNSAGETIQTTKRVDGTYKLYFYDEASLGNFFSWNASVELGGVVLNYQDLRHNATHRVKLYADHSVGSLFDWEKHGYDRPASQDLSGKGGTTGGEATVYFDMNGHSLITTGTATPNSATLFLYSSQSGAHFILEAGAAFYVGDDATLYLGSDQKSTNTSIKDYLNIHAKSLFSYLNSGFGAYIYGGHYYQTDATTSHFAQVSGRVKAVANASFYVKGGIAVFDDSADRNHGDFVKGTITATGCNFYSNGASPILKGTKGATLKFSGCNFYGVSTDIDAAAGTATLTDCTNNAAVTYKTATFFDGTTAFYYTTNEAFAKAFIQGHPSADIEIPPHEIAEGKEMFYVYEPVKVFECDADLNTRVVDAGERVRVYMTVEINGVKEYKTDAATYESELKALFAGMHTGWKVVLYADAKHPAVLAYGSHNVSRYLDLNGHTWTLTGKQSGYALDVSTKLYIYSSKPGAVLNALDADLLFRTNDYTDKNVTPNVQSYGFLYLGEPDDTSAAYGNNLTVNCKQIANYLWSSAVSIYGGIYRQTEGSTAANFMVVSRTDSASSHFNTIRNATFIVTNPNTRILRWAHSGTKVLSNCNFICEGDRSAYLFASDFTTSGTIAAPVFENANFYNVIPAQQFNYNKSGSSVAVVPTYNYNNKPASFGFPEKVPGDDLDPTDGVMILAYAKNVVEKEIAGKTYPMNAIMTSDLSKVLKLTWGAEIDYWEIGTKPSREAEDTTMIEDGVYYTNPVFDLDSIAQIENGFVTAAGDVIVDIVFKNQQVIAFTYRDTATDTLYFVFAEDCPDEISVGEKFYELFNAPQAGYVITMYKDMTISKAMGFGHLASYSEGGFNRDYYNSLVKGAITLDLNGQTITIDASLVGINLASANFAESTPDAQNAYKPAVFALECSVERFFTLKSSKPNAQIINNSTASLFGVGEGDSGAYKILDEDNNITIRSKGKIFAGIESYGYTIFNVNGGTYIYEGTESIANISRTIVLENATFICTQKTASFFTADGYRYNNLTATNCVFYSPSGTKLLAKGAGHSSAFASATATSTSEFTFNSCDFVNVNLTEKLTVNYKVSDVPTDFHAYATYVSPNVSTEADLALAYAGADLTGLAKAYLYKTVNGVDYKLMGYFADGFATVNWGFGLTENWLIGSKATHENAVIDGIFTYAFKPIDKVASAGNEVTFALRGVETDIIQMSLTLQSYIGMNVTFGEKLQNAIITVDGKTVDASQRFTMAIAPNVANQSIIFTIKIGDNTHIVPLGIDKYAKALINSETQPAEAKNLAYAMVEYVRVMTGDEDFCDVKAPEGYTAVIIPERTPTEATGEEKTESGYFISFNLDSTIAIAVTGGTTEMVTLKIANREVMKTMEGGTVVFEPLAVNELDNVFSVTIGETTYEYSLVEYYYAMPTTQNAKVVEALYNYAHHAKAYVIALQEAANGNAENA